MKNFLFLFEMIHFQKFQLFGAKSIEILQISIELSSLSPSFKLFHNFQPLLSNFSSQFRILNRDTQIFSLDFSSENEEIFTFSSAREKWSSVRENREDRERKSLEKPRVSQAFIWGDHATCFKWIPKGNWEEKQRKLSLLERENDH